MVTVDEQSKTFTATSGAATATLQFRRRANRLIVIHTMVPPEAEGAGLGGRLVTAAVAYAAERGLTVVPICPFAQSWLRSHPDVAATADIEWPPAGDAADNDG